MNSADLAACDVLYRVTLGSVAVPAAMLVPSSGAEEIMRVPLSSLIVHSPDGWFMCDLGLHPSFRRTEVWEAVLPWGAPAFPADGDPVEEMLESCGLGTSDLSGVIMSHLHLDHTGGLAHFRDGPPIIVQRDELELAQGPEGGPELFYRPEDYTDEALRWAPISGAQTIAAGIEAIPTPGHTAGHMSLKIRLAQAGEVIYAFDAIPTLWNVENDEVTAVGVPERVSDQREVSHRKLIDLADKTGAPLVPGHCPRSWDEVGSAPRRFT
jgi:glyoxylase-like metal-dependent hydrolase (beta-lactamase superfamily II)